MADYRITQFPERTEVDSTDFVLMDSDDNGTNKFALARMQAALQADIDTRATSEALAAETQAREDLSESVGDLKSALNDIDEFTENLIHLVENVPYDTTSSYWYKKATSILSTNKKYVLKIIFEASATGRTIQAGTRSNSDYMVDTIYSGDVVANVPVYVYDYVPSVADIRYFRSSANVAWTLYLYEVIVTDGIVDSLQDATEKLNTFGKIVNKENLFVGAHFVENKYYYAGAGNSTSYSYFEVNVESGKSYIFGSNVYWISSASTGISDSTLLAGTPYTAQATEKQYFTVLNEHRYKWAMCESTVDVATVGTYDAPTLSVNILKQESGTGKSQVMSQKATTDAIANATHDIPPTNIDGITIKDGTDLLILAEVTNGKYAYVQNNTLKWGTSASYKTYKIPAKQGTYTCVGGANFVVPVTANDTPLDYVDSLTLTITCPALTEYLYLSVSSAHWEEFKIGYGTATPTSTKYDFPMLYVNDASVIENKIYGKGYARVTGALSNGQSFTLARTNVKKNNVFSFLAKITSFLSILIGHGKNAYDSSYLVIDGTKITRHNYTSTDDVREYTHGLTIDDYIYVEIQVGVGLAKVIVYSNQQTYTINETTWSGDGNADIFVESNGSTLTDCVFTWSSGDFRKSVWMYGDSYFSMTSASRWPYYLDQYGYIDNVLLNAYPGEATSGALTALGNALTYYGKPKFIVWCLGMNDGADTNENTPSSSWMNGVNSVLAYCNQYDITPIFATIPSVPTLYHEGKNKWVRESGYRYIDFAKAVGATSEGVWYDGMLSTDEVHPATPGAIALYFRAIADAPEITFTNP